MRGALEDPTMADTCCEERSVLPSSIPQKDTLKSRSTERMTWDFANVQELTIDRCGLLIDKVNVTHELAK